VARGIDMFDCVMPTRNGRHGMAFTRFGQINLRNARHADDPRPLDEESEWPAARNISRAYLHHLVRSGETLGAMLLIGNQRGVLPAPDAGNARGDREGTFETFQ
jgi:queuine tRNA-ribosyltransferase